MGATSAASYFGGSYVDTFSADFTLGWSESRRLVLLNPNAGGVTVTLEAASGAHIPTGNLVWVIVNTDLALSVTIADTEGEFSESLGVGEAAVIHKYLNSGGNARFFCDKRDQL